MTVPLALEDLARQALDGDRDAIQRLVHALQGELYALALRMLWHREDAEDATQEILMRIVTRLTQFEFRSRLKTWAYRLAVNYILDVKKSAIERQRLDFGQFAENLVNGLEPASANDMVHSLHRRSQGGVQPRHAAVSRPSPSSRVRARRDHGTIRARSR
jgi:RNA polymerase sigma factor (sigma-70 family)